MSGTTPNLGYPYPTGTDRVMDGDNAIQALAESVETVQIGSNVSVPVPPFGAGGFEVYRRGRVGFLRMEGLAVNAPGISVGATIATVPAGYRPPVMFRAFAFQYAGSNVTAIFMLEVQAGGAVVTASAIPSGAIIYGSSAYPL